MRNRVEREFDAQVKKYGAIVMCSVCGKLVTESLATVYDGDFMCLTCTEARFLK